MSLTGNRKGEKCSGTFQGACDGGWTILKRSPTQEEIQGEAKQCKPESKEAEGCNSLLVLWQRRPLQGRLSFLEEEGSNAARSTAGDGDDNLIAVFSKINMMEDDMAWWIDSGATRHI